MFINAYLEMASREAITQFSDQYSKLHGLINQKAMGFHS